MPVFYHMFPHTNERGKDQVDEVICGIINCTKNPEKASKINELPLTNIGYYT